MGEWTRKALRQIGPSLLAAGAALTGLSCGGGDITAPETGAINITTSTSGPVPDSDGYAVTIDGGVETPLGVNATVRRDSLEAGAHSVQLNGVAANCAVDGENPRSVTVSARSSTEVRFAIVCGTPVIARWTPMTSGTTMALRSIWGGSASNVFVEGDSVLHYDGQAWSSAATLSGANMWASSPTQGFALVDNGTQPFASFKFYDGSVTHGPVEGPAGGDIAVLIYDMWGSSATDVFAVGLLVLGIGYWQPYVLHYDGKDWVRMSLPPEESVYVTPYAVWGSSGSDVYAVGVYLPPDAGPGEERGVIAHYDGHQWTEVLREPNLGFDHIWGSSATDVYATGSSGNYPGVGAIWHFDGHRWSALTSPTSVRLGAVWETSPSNLFVLADDHTIWQFDGATWKPAYTSATALYAIWGSSATDAFAVGENGTILHGTP